MARWGGNPGLPSRDLPEVHERSEPADAAQIIRCCDWIEFDFSGDLLPNHHLADIALNGPATR